MALKPPARRVDTVHDREREARVITVIVIVVALGAATAHLFVSRQPRTRRRALDLYLLYTLLVGVGVGGLFGAAGHLLAPDRVAEQLGWATGSPFQTEVGLFDLAFGVLGVGCIWWRRQWWYAVAAGWSVFAVGAGVNHVIDLVSRGNEAGLNAGSALPDLLVPALLLALFVARWAADRRAVRAPAAAP